MANDISIGQQGVAAAGIAMQRSEKTGAQGMLMGNVAVVQDSPMSLLAEAAEELTFSVDTTDEFELTDRKEKEKIEESLAKRVKLYQELMHHVGKTQEMDTLHRTLRTVRNRIEAFREARQFFPDSSDAWVALGEILEKLEQEKADPEVLEAVRSAREQLETEQGSEIRAGINGALAAAGFDDIGTTDELKNLYRQTVCEFTSVTEVYARVQSRYQEAGFERAVDFLYAALGTDMATETPSMETAHMESVNTSLGQLRLLQSAHAQCERLLNRWESVHGITAAKDAGLSSMELLGDIVGLSRAQFISSYDIERIAEKAKAPDIERNVLFLQEMLTMARSFPSSLFDGDAGRMKVIDAVQDAVDKAVTREDEYLASLE